MARRPLPDQAWLLAADPDDAPPPRAEADPQIVQYERYNEELARRRNALIVAVARAIAFLDREQWESAKAVLQEARERDGCD